MTTWFTLALALLGTDATGFIGTVRIAGSANNRQVLLRVGDTDTPIIGPMLAEVAHLGGAKVELLGQRVDGSVRAEDYRILAVGDATRPLVGILRDVGNGGLALGGDSGDPVALSMNASTRKLLATKAGAKIWVSGEKLLSGELRVARWGLLREAPGAALPVRKDKIGED